MAKKQGFSLNDLKDKGMIEISPGVFQKVSNPQPRDFEANKIKRAALQEKRMPIRPELYPLTMDDVFFKELVFKWADKHVSLNEWYSSKHWSQRNKIKQDWHEFFKSYLPVPYPKFNKYKVQLVYNSRLDPSNTIPIIKLCEDMLTECGVIPNDTKEFCKGIEIIPDETMKKFSYKLTIINIFTDDTIRNT